MEPADVEAVAAIEMAVSAQPWSEELFAGEFDVDPLSRHWLVAVGPADDRVCGFGGALWVGGNAHIMNLAVTPARQRLGIGRRLLARMLLDAANRGIVAVTLEVRDANGPALALYRSFGFQVVGRRSDYYQDGTDAVVMWISSLQRPDCRRRLQMLAC